MDNNFLGSLLAEGLCATRLIRFLDEASRRLDAMDCGLVHRVGFRRVVEPTGHRLPIDKLQVCATRWILLQWMAELLRN